MNSPSKLLNRDLIADLRETITGQVITPTDAGYDESRQLFYGGYDHRPAVIIKVAGVDDVVRVVSLARETGLPLGIRSGGHSMAGHSVPDGGIMLDLSAMKEIEIDPERRIAWAETGVTAGELTAAANQHGLAIGFGDTGSVGIGGITLGGGVGFLSRKYGLTIDNLLAAEVVTADGQVLHVDESNHPDLFWAIRGGGGNFGVATRFRYRLHEVNQVVGGMLILPATPEAITAFIAEADAAPEELSTIANVMSAPPMPFLPPELHGRLILLAFMVYTGDVEAGQRAIAPFRAITQPLADMVRPMAYPEMFPPEEEAYHPMAEGRTLFLDRVDLDTARRIIEHLQASDAPMRVLQLRVLGGAVARVPANATAYPHRQAPIMANVAAFFTGPEDRPRRVEWVTNFARDLYQGNGGMYVNFLGEGDESQVRGAYPGDTWDRLAAVKLRYDPDNLFHLNQNVPPAPQASGR
ncbi:MAG TPA: FAD-binding oxidoreductase [Anaerolineaceae bacterium]|nr:FAD-binding oxidoreductase [Anaerolineaceae bacterium]